MPPAPAQYFNDYANVVSPATANHLNKTLEDFERDTSSQLRVVVYPKMESDSSIDDYAVRVARAWKIGQKKENNGAILFVFVQDHKMTIQVGYGLEGALPDGLCKRIINQEITPRFKQGDFDGGLSAGVAAMIAATKGEYKGTGRTVNHGQGGSSSIFSSAFITIFITIFILFIILNIFRGSGRGGGGWLIVGGGGGAGWSGWRRRWGGGGGFSSGGGGSFGGGGAERELVNI